METAEFLSTPLHPPALMFFLAHLFLLFSETWGGGEELDADVSFNPGSLISSPLMSSTSSRSSSHYIKTLLWLILRAIQIYGYGHTYLGWSLTMWPFSKTAMVGSLIGPVILQVQVFDQVCSTRPEISSVEQVLQPIESGWLPHSRHATGASLGTPCLVDWYCSRQVPRLREIIDVFFRLKACL